MIQIDKDYTIPEVAELMGLTKAAIYRAVHLGRLPAFGARRKRKIKGYDLKNYKDSRWKEKNHLPVEEMKIRSNDSILSECYRIARFCGLRIYQDEKGFFVALNNKVYAANLALPNLLAFLQGCDMFHRINEKYEIPQYQR